VLNPTNRRRDGHHAAQEGEGVLSGVEELARALVATHAVPGLSVAIVGDRLPPSVRAWGLASVARGTPVTPDTVVRRASLSKVVTAVALLQLWERGRVGLDDPVNTRLRGYRVAHADPAEPPMTVRHGLAPIASRALHW
jgi:CubicO group peptidase (beta-lactamase class C family)